MFGMPVIEHCEDPTLKGDGVAHEGFHAAALGPARHSRRRRGARRRARHPAGGADGIGVPRRAHERAHVAARGAQGQGRGHSRDVRGGAASLHADRRSARHADSVRHEHEDEPAAARGGRSRRHGAGHRRRQRRRDCHRPRAASLRREEGRVRPRAVRDRRPRDGRAARLRSAGACRADPAVAADRAAVGQPGADPARARRHAVRGRAGRHHDPGARPEGADRAANRLRSRSKNTPFDGWELRGGVAATLVGGRTVFVNPERR